MLNYPALDWRFASGEWHTVPVGYLGEEPQVVMDILHFDTITAEQSLALKVPGPRMRERQIKALKRKARQLGLEVSEKTPGGTAAEEASKQG